MSSDARVLTLIALIRMTSRAMVDEITERLEAAGFPDSPPRFHPVFESMDPKGTRLTVLAARAGMTHQAMGEVVRELEARGYVERIPDPGDGRARIVRLTADGRKLVRAGIREVAAIERKWMRRWRAAGLEGDLQAALEAALREEGAWGPPT